MSFRHLSVHALAFGQLLIAGICHAQSASNDPTFNPSDPGYGHGDGVTGGYVSDLVVQPDDKVIVVGSFDRYNNAQLNRIARLLPDGTVDTDFDPGSGTSSPILAVALQPDGKVIVGGNFLAFDGIARSRIARLNSDGSVDLTFDPGSGANDWVRDVEVQPDGKVLVAGEFTDFNGLQRNRITRLNDDGSLDLSFDPLGTGTNGDINSIALEPSGNILIGGTFSSVQDSTLGTFARLLPDGSLDASFNIGTGTTSEVRTVAVQADGKILLGGYFSSFNGVPCDNMTRLNSDGSLDPTFDIGDGPSSYVLGLAVQPDQKILVWGLFFTFDSVPRQRLARLLPTGELDATFDTANGFDSLVESAGIQSNGKVIAAGQFTMYRDALRNRVLRLENDGSVDHAFVQQTGANHHVEDMALTPDGNLILAGSFTSYNGVFRYRAAKIDADGALDTSFTVPGTTGILWIDEIAVQPDGKVVIAGFIISVGGTPREGIARLHPDGSLDTSFDPGSGMDGGLSELYVLPNGNVLVAGSLTEYDGVPRKSIARILPNGSLDTAFDPGVGPNGTISDVAVQPDGKVVIVGNFTEVSGVTRKRIARLNADGSLDTSFDPGLGANNDVLAVELQPDGKLLIGGYFSQVNGVAKYGFARLFSDGSLEVAFPGGIGPNALVATIHLQPDSRILIAGNFTMFSGYVRNRMARLEPSGAVDLTFYPGNGPDIGASNFITLADGKVIMSGRFTSYDGVGRNRIAKLNADFVLSAPAAQITGPVSAWPVPSRDIVHFSSAVSGSLCDVQGRTLFVVDGVASLDQTLLVPGTYVFRTHEGQVLRLVKE